LLDILIQRYIIYNNIKGDADDLISQFMESEEIQNRTVDHGLGANGAGITLGREEESETTAPSNFIDDDRIASSLFENEIKKQIEAKSLAPRTPAFAKVEKSLASVGFFTPSSRRIKNQKVKVVHFAREIDGQRMSATAEIHPSAMFGLPVTADQDKYLALQKIITNTLHAEGKVTNPIRFKSSELLRLMNTSTKTGKNYKAISEWLDVMYTTTIISDGAVYVTGQKRFARDRFRVFDRALSFGKVMDDGTIADANYVWLSEWQLENINNKFLMPIDLETYRELKNHIAKALVPLLQTWLYASHKAEAFEKRYSELCEILTLQTYRAPSQILRQFKPSLDELVHHGYIEKWRIEKTSDRKAFKVVFFHGPKFYRDRRRRVEQKSQVEAPVVIGEFEGDEPRLPEPGAPVDTSTGKTPSITDRNPELQASSNIPGDLVDSLSARGLMPSAVLRLLGALSSDRLAAVDDYIDYWDKAKKEGDVGPGFLYELIKNGDPLPAGFETRRQQAARIAAEERRRNAARIEERIKADYVKYTEQLIDRCIADLPPGDFERRVAAHKSEAASQSDFWSQRPDMADQFARHAVRTEISKSLSLLSYEDFRRLEMPRVAVQFHLNASEFDVGLGNGGAVGEGTQPAG
jgi:hypothetical protein